MTPTSLRLRAPLGRKDAVPSSVTGAILEYYTPHPLSELIAQCAGPSSASHRDMHCAALTLVHASSRRRDHVDGTVSRLSAEALLTGKVWRTVPELLGLGQTLVPSINGLRDAAAYSGASLAAAARHIYAPSGALPSLMVGMAEVFAAPKALDPVAFAAMVGFFCIHAHPFPDGNGRWARLVALSTGAITSGPWEAASVSLFLTTFNDELCSEIFPRAREAGAQEYLDKARLFEDALYKALLGMNVPQAVDALNSELKTATRGRAVSNALLGDLYSRGHLATEATRARLGLSRKAMGGLAYRLASQSAGLLTADDEAISIDKLLSQVDAAIEVAAKKVRD